MDANYSKMAEMLCQAVQRDKPTICRECGEKLISGVNWYKSCEDHKAKICKSCQGDSAREWHNDNMDHVKKLRYINSRTVATRYRKSVHNAKHKKVTWSLTLEEYTSLISNSCRYCGHNLTEAGIGLDQIIAGGGYIRENVVPCCLECNTAKSYLFNYDEMLLIGVVIKKIKDQRKLLNPSESA